MATSCHICSSKVAGNGAVADDIEEGFECADCGNMTCPDCKSIGVAMSTNHCQRCRG